MLDHNEEEEDSPVQIVLFHHLSNLYKWDWETFWEKTPVPVIKWLTKLIDQKAEHGFISHDEFSGLKNVARQAGYKGFDRG